MSARRASRCHAARVRVVLFACLALFSLSGIAQDVVAPSLARAISRVDEWAAAEQAKDNLGGATIGVVAAGKLVWTKAYGWADMENKTPAANDTVYRIGSITKWFTGVMLLQLVQDGKVALADPVAKHLAEVEYVQHRAAFSPPITLEQLATMTSGFAREPANLGKYLRGPVSDWEKVLIAALHDTSYANAPGSRTLYSNIGYATLGAALGRAAGVSYVDFVQQRILTPLRMSDTAFEPNPAIVPRLAKGYQVGRSGEASFQLSQREHAGRGYKVPNGALYSTVADLARFIAFQLGEGPDAVLSKDVLDATYSQLAASSGGRSRYGIGVLLVERSGLVTFGHNGDVPGYLTHARMHRPSKTGVIVLRNVNGGSFDVDGLVHKALAELVQR
jgi:CubicO group peptidase (beta-lactamase class C family)